MSDGNPYNSNGRPYNGGGGGNGNWRGGGGGGNWKGNNGNGGGNWRSGNGGNGGGQRFGKTYTEEELKNAVLPRYVVISGNDTPTGDASEKAMRLVGAFERAGFIVRTGGLKGIDDVVTSTTQKAELHLPFKNFNQKESASQFSNELCIEFARRFAPDLDSMPNVPKAILAKNPRLVLGKNLNSPAQLVIVWSDDGAEHPSECGPRSGNAGHIVKIANHTGIRVINLKRPDAEARAMQFLENIYVQQAQQPATQQPTAPAAEPANTGYAAGQGHGDAGYGQHQAQQQYGAAPSHGNFGPSNPSNGQHPGAGYGGQHHGHPNPSLNNRSQYDSY